MEAMDIKYKTGAVFPNGGAAKKMKPAAVAPAAVGEPMYRECLKNHAASMGGHAVDGCGEFMPSPAANAADPSSLKCAACGCHRNFHRRTVEGAGSPPPAAPVVPAPLALPAPVVPPPAGVVLHGQTQHRREDTPEDRLPAVVDGDDSTSDSDASEYDEERSLSPPPPQLHHHHHHHHAPAPVAQQPPPPPYYPAAPHMLLSLGSGGPPGVQRLPGAQLTSPAKAPPPGGAPVPRKRFRTKFTAEQKQRMQELSERLGWRLQKRDEAIVDEWCRDIGVGKGVFKVWMHNNKHNFLGGHSARRSLSASDAAVAPLHTPTTPAGGSVPPPFHPSAASSPPPPPVLSSSPRGAGFININGAIAAPSAPNAAPAAVHQQESIINGSSASPQSTA